MYRCILVLLLFSAAWLAGCAPSAPPVPPVVEQLEARAPFELSVLEDVNDGRNVFVRAKLLSHTNWPLSKVALRATGLHDGEEKSSQVLSLEKLLNQSGALTAGEERELTLTLPAQDISDYQLELVWGEALTPPRVQTPALHARELRTERRSQDCALPPCPEILTVKGVLVNEGDTQIQNAKLGIGLIWLANGAELDLSTQIPQDEEFIELADMQLAPGARREVAIDIDRALPSREGGRFEALLRVVP